jgi:hypothetical protein
MRSAALLIASGSVSTACAMSTAPHPSETPALDLRDVFKIYRDGANETVALRGLDLRVERG